MKHVTLNSVARALPVRADQKGVLMANPCDGLTGLGHKKCEKKHAAAL
jgi:hypothetical protein